MSSRRPRRSRIYDSNYSIGENYYKSAIDRLDAKYHTTVVPSSILLRHSEPPALSPPRPRFVRGALDDDLAEEDLEYSRERASRAIQKETILDQRSGRRGLDLESSFDGQVSYLSSKIHFVSQDRNIYIFGKARINIWMFILDEGKKDLRHCLRNEKYKPTHLDGRREKAVFVNIYFYISGSKNIGSHSGV